jgi:hypothetical protein
MFCDTLTTPWNEFHIDTKLQAKLYFLFFLSSVLVQTFDAHLLQTKYITSMKPLEILRRKFTFAFSS